MCLGGLGPVLKDKKSKFGAYFLGVVTVIIVTLSLMVCLLSSPNEKLLVWFFSLVGSSINGTNESRPLLSCF